MFEEKDDDLAGGGEESMWIPRSRRLYKQMKKSMGEKLKS